MWKSESVNESYINNYVPGVPRCGSGQKSPLRLTFEVREGGDMRRGLGKKKNKSNKSCGMGFGDIPMVDFGAMVDLARIFLPHPLSPSSSLSSCCLHPATLCFP